MTVRPSVTVTFLFTDITGSTRLWERDTAAMDRALAEHDSVLREVFTRHGGRLFATGGDGFCVAFDDATAALATAIDGRRALLASPLARSFEVRMALDTGAVHERDGDFFGPPLNRTARILGHARGRQTLLSHVTADLVRHSLPEGTSLRRGGTHHLKGIRGRVTVLRLLDRSTARTSQLSGRAAVAGVVALMTLAAGWWLFVGDAPVEPTVASVQPSVQPPTTGSWAHVWIANPWPGGSIDHLVPVGEVVVVFGRGGDGSVVTAIDLESGKGQWQDDVDLPDRVLWAESVGRDVFYATRDTLGVIDVTHGAVIGGCGLTLPQAGVLPTSGTFVTVGQRATYLATTSGEVHRVVTNVGTDRCHGSPRNSRPFGQIVAPPVDIAAGVAIIRSGSIELLDGETLEEARLERLSNDASGVVSDWSAGRESLVYFLEGRELRAWDADTFRVLTGPVLTDVDPAVSRGGVHVLTDGDVLQTWDHNLGDVRWIWELGDASVEDDDVRVDPGSVSQILAGDAIVAVVGDEAFEVLGMDTGDWKESVAIPFRVASAAAVGDAVLVAGREGSLGLWSEGASPPDRLPLSQVPRFDTDHASSEDLARRFLSAWVTADRRALERLVGVDAKVRIGGRSQSMWDPDTRDVFWGISDFVAALGARVEVGACRTSGAAETEEVECDVTYADAVHRDEDSLAGFARFRMAGGLIRETMGGGLPPLAVAGLDLDSAWGFAGAQVLEHVTEIRQTYPGDWLSRCIENQAFWHTSADCGQFYVEHLGGER